MESLAQSSVGGPGEPLGLEQWFLLEHSRLKPVTAARWSLSQPVHLSACKQAE